jgi:glutamate synthase domain-containing protein 3
MLVSRFHLGQTDDVPKRRETPVANARCPKTAAILDDWDRARGAFWRVAPREDVAKISQKNEGTRAGAKA